MGKRAFTEINYILLDIVLRYASGEGRGTKITSTGLTSKEEPIVDVSVTKKNAIEKYVAEISKQFATGKATEHSYRPALTAIKLIYV